MLTDEQIDQLEGRELDEAVALVSGCPILGTAAVAWVDGSETIDLDDDRQEPEWPYSREPIIRNPIYTKPPIPDKGYQWTGSDGNQYTREAANLGGVPLMELMALPTYHSDLGAAMSLLMGLSNESCHSVILHVVGGDCQMSAYASVLDLHEGKPLASGPKSDAGAICCRAFLKLKGRG